MDATVALEWRPRQTHSRMRFGRRFFGEEILEQEFLEGYGIGCAGFSAGTQWVWRGLPFFIDGQWVGWGTQAFHTLCRNCRFE